MIVCWCQQLMQMLAATSLFFSFQEALSCSKHQESHPCPLMALRYHTLVVPCRSGTSRLPCWSLSVVLLMDTSAEELGLRGARLMVQIFRWLQLYVWWKPYGPGETTCGHLLQVSAAKAEVKEWKREAQAAEEERQRWAPQAALDSPSTPATPSWTPMPSSAPYHTLNGSSRSMLGR